MGEPQEDTIGLPGTNRDGKNIIAHSIRMQLIDKSKHHIHCYGFTGKIKCMQVQINKGLEYNIHK